jgi:hypothetical protein
MICPECNGVGRVRKRFLLFFMRPARCPKCLGTGEFPPPVREVLRRGTTYRDDHDDRWPVASYGSTTTGSGVRDSELFDFGGGGRSGGGGGGATWDDSQESATPVIADPFSSGGGSSSSGGSSIVSSAVAEAAAAGAVADDAISSDPSSSTSDSSSSSSSSDSGTSY